MKDKPWMNDLEVIVDEGESRHCDKFDFTSRVMKKPTFLLKRWRMQTMLNGSARIWGKGYGYFFRDDGLPTSDRIVQYYCHDYGRNDIVETLDYYYVLGDQYEVTNGSD